MFVFIKKIGENVHLRAKNSHFWSKIDICKGFRIFGLKFSSFFRSDRENSRYKFSKMVIFLQKWQFRRIWCPGICKINDPILQNAFYSRIFVIISRLFAYNWTKCRNLQFLRFLVEIVKIVSHKILMWQKCGNLRYLNGTFFSNDTF